MQGRNTHENGKAAFVAATCVPLSPKAYILSEYDMTNEAVPTNMEYIHPSERHTVMTSDPVIRSTIFVERGHSKECKP
jgi:hypothetical protein